MNRMILEPMAIRTVYRVDSMDKRIPDVRALNYDQAALLAARKLFGQGVTVERVYGLENFCGYYQAFMTVGAWRNRVPEIRPVGKPFYIVRRDVQPTAPPRFTILNNLRYVKDEDLEDATQQIAS